MPACLRPVLPASRPATGTTPGRRGAAAQHVSLSSSESPSPRTLHTRELGWRSGGLRRLCQHRWLLPPEVFRVRAMGPLVVLHALVSASEYLRHQSASASRLPRTRNTRSSSTLSFALASTANRISRLAGPHRVSLLPSSLHYLRPQRLPPHPPSSTFSHTKDL
jgi:hypothetical protein